MDDSGVPPFQEPPIQCVILQYSEFSVFVVFPSAGQKKMCLGKTYGRVDQSSDIYCLNLFNTWTHIEIYTLYIIIFTYIIYIPTPSSCLVIFQCITYSFQGWFNPQHNQTSSMLNHGLTQVSTINYIKSTLTQTEIGFDTPKSL